MKKRFAILLTELLLERFKEITGIQPPKHIYGITQQCFIEGKFDEIWNFWKRHCDYRIKGTLEIPEVKE